MFFILEQNNYDWEKTVKILECYDDLKLYWLSKQLRRKEEKMKSISSTSEDTKVVTFR